MKDRGGSDRGKETRKEERDKREEEGETTDRFVRHVLTLVIEV